MRRLVIKNGKILSPQNGYLYDELDILIEAGIIKAVSKGFREEDTEVVDINGAIVSPGFMDIHVHCYPGESPIGTDADTIGINRGATVIFDAGTSGPMNFEDFYETTIKKAKTKIYAYLNISDYGLATLNELTDINGINGDRVLQVVNKYRDVIKGIKVRASGSVVGENGLKPLILGKKIAVSAGLPLVVHIGNYPPDVVEVLDLLDKDDIVTHAYHGKKNGLFNEDGSLKAQVISAKNRGVRFDVGHGSASFNFNSFKKALKNDLRPDFISTDIYHKNMIEPVGSILNVITKMIGEGLSLETCVTKVTSDVADFFNLDRLGEVKEGYIGDFTIFKVEDCNDIVIDSEGNEKNINKRLELQYVVSSTGGKNSEVLKFDKK